MFSGELIHNIIYVKSQYINIDNSPFNLLLVIVDLSSFFKKQRVLIDLSQVALVAGRVASICNRIDKLRKVDLSKAAKATKLIHSH